MTSAALTPTALRVFIYDHVLARGLPPTSGEIGAHFRVSPEEARGAVGSLGIGKTVLPDPKTGEIWMAGAFASRPSPYWVIGRDMSWPANCAWDMLGIAAIVGEPVQAEATCTDCGDPIVFDVTPERGVGEEAGGLLVHFLLPARRWYDDIGFT